MSMRNVKRMRQVEEEMTRIRESMAQMLAQDSQGDTSDNNHSPPPSSA